MKLADLFFAVSIIYLVNSLFYLINIAFKKNILEKISLSLTGLGFFFHTIGLILWMKKAGHIPFTNLYESTVFFSWAIILVYLFVAYKYKIIFIGGLVVPLAFIAIGAASVLPESYKDIEPLVPALQSYWRDIHVAACILGYAFLAFSFCTSIVFLVKASENLDNITYKSITIGFLLLTIGILSGAIWANVAWGRYWGWDPKETWSLITWIIYAIYLHARFLKGWQEKKMAYLSVIGFVSVLFTYWGVNLLLSGLHSYAK